MPFRETTVLLRYDTEDIVQLLPGPFTCSLRHQQATSNILGKLRLSVKTKSGWIFPRSILEILESDESVSLPARFGVYALKDGVFVEVFAANREQVHKRICHKIIEKGIPLIGMQIHDDPIDIQTPYPWRGDLTELSFNRSSSSSVMQ
jgi:phenylacetate-coenzyme A ligase PaaK-like adenylate-forming protein